MGKTLTATPLLLALALCSPSLGNLCSAVPIRPDAGFEQRWTLDEKRQVLVLNTAGEEICPRPF